jgi:hypothetical protein
VATASAGDRPAARRSHAVASARTLSELRPSILPASKVTSLGPADESRAEPKLARPPPSSISWHEARVAHSRAAREEKATRSWSGVNTYTAPDAAASASVECGLAGDDAAGARRGGGDSQAISSYMSEAPEVSLHAEPERRSRSDVRRGRDRRRISERRRIVQGQGAYSEILSIYS